MGASCSSEKASDVIEESDPKKDANSNQNENVNQNKESKTKSIPNKDTKLTINQTQNQNQNNKLSTKNYYEKHNVGTLYDNYDSVKTFWLAWSLKKEKPPFIVYTFDSLSNAAQAFLELSFIKRAKDTGNFICLKTYDFGLYLNNEKKYEVLICSRGLSIEDFEEAENTFEKYGGKCKNVKKPSESSKINNDNPKDSENEKTVTFSKKYQTQMLGAIMTYEIYSARNKDIAMAFLKKKPVTEKCYYVVVETPEGNFGRDINGIYQE